MERRHRGGIAGLAVPCGARTSAWLLAQGHREECAADLLFRIGPPTGDPSVQLGWGQPGVGPADGGVGEGRGRRAIPSGPWSLDVVRAAAARVHAAEPDAAYAKDTMAPALFADGDLPRAAVLADAALTEAEGHDRAMVLCTLIGIANAQGNTALAEERAAEARQLDPACPRPGWALRAISAAPKGES